MIKRLVFALLMALTGCGGGSEIALPLADDQATVLFFYTDN